MQNNDAVLEHIIAQLRTHIITHFDATRQPEVPTATTIRERREIERLECEIERLERKLGNLHTSNKDLRKRNTTLVRQNQDLRDDIDDMASKLHSAYRDRFPGISAVWDKFRAPAVQVCQEQSGCRKEDAQVCRTLSNHSFLVTDGCCIHCGKHTSEVPGT